MKLKNWFVTAISMLTFTLVVAGCGGGAAPVAPTPTSEPTQAAAPTLASEPTKPVAPTPTSEPTQAAAPAATSTQEASAAPMIFEKVEDRLKAWQAQIPSEYASKKNPYSVSDTTAVAAGEKIYEENHCAACHGDELKGDGGFSEVLDPKPIDLTDHVLMSLPFVTDTYLFWRISEGGGQPPFFSAMPIWKKKLSEQERWQLVTFIRSKTTPEVSESSEAEEDKSQAVIAVIEKAGCFACHRLGNRGGPIGPEWNGIGTRAATRIPGMSAEEYIRQSILDPQAFVPPGFEDKAKLMPASFGESLTKEELELVIEFLLQQK